MFAHRAVEALAVIIVVQSFYPTVASLDWESTREAFRGKQFVPVYIKEKIVILFSYLIE